MGEDQHLPEICLHPHHDHERRMGGESCCMPHLHCQEGPKGRLQEDCSCSLIVLEGAHPEHQKDYKYIRMNCTAEGLLPAEVG